MSKKFADKQISRCAVKTIRVTWTCPECLDGGMIAVRMVVIAGETLWEHECDCCGFESCTSDEYPRLEYEDQPAEITF